MKEIELKVTVSPTLGMRVERQGKGFAEAKCFGNILKKKYEDLINSYKK